MAIQNSINTNIGAYVALQNLNQVNTKLNTVQNRVSTGLKVNSAVDDASSFSIGLPVQEHSLSKMTTTVNIVMTDRRFRRWPDSTGKAASFTSAPSPRFSFQL